MSAHDDVGREKRRAGMTLEERFWRLVVPEPNTGCWLWMGTCTPDGYGRFNIVSGSGYAHRWVRLKLNVEELA